MLELRSGRAEVFDEAGCVTMTRKARILPFTKKAPADSHLTGALTNNSRSWGSGEMADSDSTVFLGDSRDDVTIEAPEDDPRTEAEIRAERAYRDLDRGEL